MKACIIQPPYSQDVSRSDELFKYKMNQLVPHQRSKKPFSTTIDILIYLWINAEKLPADAHL